ncbi:transposase [Bradyrhizobium sp. TZ2]
MAHGRHDLTEFEWNVIKPLLPNKARGVPRVDDRRVLNGIFYQLRSGSPWAKGQKLQMIDSTSVRVHQQAAAQKTGWNLLYRSFERRTDHQDAFAGQRTRSAAADRTLPGQAHDAPMAELLLQDLPKGTSLLADRGYDADWIREMIEDQNCTPVIPPKSNRREEIPFSKRKYKKRNLVERCINKLKQFRHIATRYDKVRFSLPRLCKAWCYPTLAQVL